MRQGEIVINKAFVNSFLAGEMRLELKGTCTVVDLEDSVKILRLAIEQIERICSNPGLLVEAKP